MKNVLEITTEAKHQVKFLLNNTPYKEFLGIRIGVKSGGCSGFKYFIEYANSVHKYDEVIKFENISIIIDPKALLYIMGSKMDYVREEFNEGFIFQNPNEKGKCGCGKSFAI